MHKLGKIAPHESDSLSYLTYPYLYNYPFYLSSMWLVVNISSHSHLILSKITTDSGLSKSNFLATRWILLRKIYTNKVMINKRKY